LGAEGFSSFFVCVGVETCHQVILLLQAKVGRLKESDSSLQRLRGKNADIYKEANEIRVCN
jgi:hypothetical protein